MYGFGFKVIKVIPLINRENQSNFTGSAVIMARPMLLRRGILLSKKVLLFAGVFCAALALVFFWSWSSKPQVGAQVVNFYPDTCLGGWSNPRYVTREPQVQSVGDMYGEENSAVYNDNAAALYCGEYAGTLPAETKHTEVVLRFSWTQDIEDAPLSYPNITEIDEEGGEVPFNASTSTEIGGTSSEETSSLDVPPEEAVPTEPAVQEEIPPSEESAAEPEPEPVPSEEVSLKAFFVSTANAQEEVFEDISSDAQFRVEYTLDGNNWTVLGYVSDISNDVKLTFPRGVFTDIEDISRVQIGLVPLIKIDSAPAPIYLDAMWLEVEYAPLVQVALHEAIDHTPKEYNFSNISFVSTSSSATLGTTTASATPTANISPASIVNIHGIDRRYIILHTKLSDSEYQLWLFDLIKQEAKIIADTTLTIGAHKGGIKDRMIFWYSAAKDRIYVYDLRTAGTYHELLVVQNLPEQTEALQFEFPFTTWKLVDGPEQFYFRSDETGEVFSDGTAESMAQFVLTFKLDETLSAEELQAIGLSGL